MAFVLNLGPCQNALCSYFEKGRERVRCKKVRDGCRTVDQGQSVLAKSIEKPGDRKRDVNHLVLLFL